MAINKTQQSILDNVTIETEEDNGIVYKFVQVAVCDSNGADAGWLRKYPRDENGNKKPLDDITDDDIKDQMVELVSQMGEVYEVGESEEEVKPLISKSRAEVIASQTASPSAISSVRTEVNKVAAAKIQVLTDKLVEKPLEVK